MLPPPDDAPVRTVSMMAAAVHVLRAWLQGGWRAAHDIEPEFWRNLQRELLAGRQWADRAIVLAMAAATGAIVVGIHPAGRSGDRGLPACWSTGGQHGRFLTLLWTPALTVVVPVVDPPVRAGCDGLRHPAGGSRARG